MLDKLTKWLFVEKPKEPPKPEPTYRKVWNLSFIIEHYTNKSKTNINRYVSSMKCYSEEKFNEYRISCNERIIKNNEVVNAEKDENKFIVIDGGINMPDLISMERYKFLSSNIVFNLEPTLEEVVDVNIVS